ncbi:hypothetical protein [uncultured Tateyamaria sp.]|uniref:hypothetical protein n=1 Tax=uncultured Tateyamaria sp. TaxID=455651 RepID=UPI00261BBE9C|nr:hypothetical protein [uncultured Tateyamaria sp.]
MNLSFVIVEPDPVVRMDLVGTLEHSFPAGSVTACASTAEITQLFETLAASASFFVNGALLPDLAPEVTRAILAAGGRIVSVGKPATDAVPSTLLEVPFTMTTILDALANAAPDLPVPRPAGHT